MRCQLLYFAVALCLAVCGCSGGETISAHPEISAVQIEKDAEAGFPSSGADGPFKEGEIEVLESNYSRDQATIVLRAGNINVGSLASEEIEDLKPEIRPKLAKVDTIPYRLRLEYQWVRGEWRLRRLDNLTFEKP